MIYLICPPVYWCRWWCSLRVCPKVADAERQELRTRALYREILSQERRSLLWKSSQRQTVYCSKHKVVSTRFYLGFDFTVSIFSTRLWVFFIAKFDKCLTTVIFPSTHYQYARFLRFRGAAPAWSQSTTTRTDDWSSNFHVTRNKRLANLYNCDRHWPGLWSYIH